MYKMALLVPMLAVTILLGCVPGSAPTPHSAAHLRHLEDKQYMLQVINAERTNSGLNPVVLGDNNAAQLHAEAALENCSSSPHWGVDGLKPYMRYSLAGGYQSNGENGFGSDYCKKPSDGYRAIASINQKVREAVESWMGSPGHRANILRPFHKKVNIGLAWDRYNFKAYQHFEGDYVEYDSLPSIIGTVLSLSGRVKNGAQLKNPDDLSVQIYYDPPPHLLTRGQLALTYCYDNGLQVAALRQPLHGTSYWVTDEFTYEYQPCPNPYGIPPNAPGPTSLDEAHESWQAAYEASQGASQASITVPWITASEWQASTDFSVTADIGNLPAGVYTIVVWAMLGGEHEVVSEYSIFHEVTPPDTYQ